MIPEVSVVIAARNSAATIPLLLNALEAQTLGREMYQVVVIDDGSTDETRAIVGRYESVDLIVSEGNRGAPISRNAGVESARSELIAFTDSDCVPEPDWLERGVKRFRCSTELDMLGGEVIVDVDCTSSVSAMVDAARFLNQEGSAQRGGGVTANFWLRRQVFLSVGGFNERLAKLGYPDTELIRHLSSCGAHLEYDACVRVHHPPRRSWKELARKGYRLGLGHAPFRRYGRAGVGHRHVPLFLRPHRFSPIGTLSRIDRLEARGIKMSRRRRLEMLIVELACVSIPMFVGDLVGTPKMMLVNPGR